jgi:hypothetical protein
MLMAFKGIYFIFNTNPNATISTIIHYQPNKSSFTNRLQSFLLGGFGGAEKSRLMCQANGGRPFTWSWCTWSQPWFPR